MDICFLKAGGGGVVAPTAEMMDCDHPTTQVIQKMGRKILGRASSTTSTTVSLEDGDGG